MWFRGEPSQRPQALLPYAFRTKDGFLLGVAPDPAQASPCAGCVERWLTDRQVYVKRIEISEVTLRRDLIAELIAENCAHIQYEINRDGTHTRLDSLVFPHSHCRCQRAKYLSPRRVGKNTNFAFSPLFQIKCARFGTPEGNLWLTSASGELPATGSQFLAYGVGRDRENSRFRAVDEWLKQACASSADTVFQNLVTGETHRAKPSVNDSSMFGIGANEEEAVLDGLYRIAKAKVVRGYAGSMKNPMLIVGANNWIRNQVPYFLLQQYDLHLLFYPNSMPCWVVGIAAFSRLTVEEKPVFVFGAHGKIQTALDEAIFKILELCRPTEIGETPFREVAQSEKTNRHAGKLNLWWTHWIYRSAKISLRDVLQLEAYAPGMEGWKEFIRDGQPPVSFASANSGLFPSAIRHVVKVTQEADVTHNVRNINGIGTWSTFEHALS